MHNTCIASITIDSVMRMEKKNYPQVYLEVCKYKIKKTKMAKFTNTELESESVVYLIVKNLVIILLTLNKSKT